MNKKVLAVFFILSVLFIPFVLSQEGQENQSQNTENTTNVELENINDVFSQELSLNQESKGLIRVIFNLDSDEKITAEKISILTCIALWLLVLIQVALSLTLFEGLKSWVAALIITLLAGIGGAMRIIMSLMLDISNVLGITEKSSLLRLVFIILLLFLFSYGAKELLKIMKEKSEIEQAESSGMEAGAAVKDLIFRWKLKFRR